MTAASFPLTSVARVAGMPAGVDTNWLHPAEETVYRRFVSPARQLSWLAGRWWAKQRILQLWNLGVAPRELAIVSRSLSGLGSVPTVHVGTQQLSISLSLSHSPRFVAVTVGTGSPGEWGVDLVEHGGCDPARLGWWFHREELCEWTASQWLAGWAAKEAAHKTTQLTFRPRRVRLSPREPNCWDWQVDAFPRSRRGSVQVFQHADFHLAVARLQQVVDAD